MPTQIKKTKNYVFLGKYELDMVLDIHAHTALTGLFVYGNSYDDVYRLVFFWGRTASGD